MSENLQTTFTLLAVGMITVFMILFLVVILSKVMIAFINRFFPLEVEKVKSGSRIITGKSSTSKVSAIVAAVEIVTEGKGIVQRIEKID